MATPNQRQSVGDLEPSVGAKRHQPEANASDARPKITRYPNGPSTEKLRKKNQKKNTTKKHEKKTKKNDTIYRKKVNITEWDILIQNSSTLGVGGVGRSRPVRGDVPFQNHKTSPRSGKQGRGKVRGAKAHFWPPRPQLRFLGFRTYLITCPTQLRMFCEVIKKSYFDNSENQSTGTEDWKILFRRPPAVPPKTIWGKHRYVVRHISGHPPAKFGRRAGPGSARKTGSKFGEPPKKLPHFGGGIAKKRYHRVAGAEPNDPRLSRRNRPPGASAARTRKTT
jgi:hypothetical protein